MRYTARIAISGLRLLGSSIRITLKAAFAGAHGVFLVTNAWEAGGDESKQALAAVNAKDAGVQHLIWSTLPKVETISRGKIAVPHFTDKAKVDRIVSEAGFAYHTFVIAPFYYQNLLGAMAPQKQAGGSAGWALPLDPERRVIHMGAITELGRIVVGPFALPELVGHGEHLPLVGDFLYVWHSSRHVVHHEFQQFAAAWAPSHDEQSVEGAIQTRVGTSTPARLPGNAALCVLDQARDRS